MKNLLSRFLMVSFVISLISLTPGFLCAQEEGKVPESIKKELSSEDRLLELKSLYEKGLISEIEYEENKKIILQSISKAVDAVDSSALTAGNVNITIDSANIIAKETEVKVEEEEGEPQVFVIREAKKFQKSIVGVEAYLIDNILEVKIVARMFRKKPRIYNALVVGPKLGRLNIESKDILFQSVEEDEAFLTTQKDRAFISFKKKEQMREGVGRGGSVKGTLTRELVRFDIPRDKVKKDKLYRLWVQIMSMKKGGQYHTFKFDLKNEETDENLADFLEESAERTMQYQMQHQ
ncbi:SHOCT domain-containing protein [Candidatus Omnitrophota bacterium]